MQTHTPYCFLLSKSCALHNNIGEMQECIWKAPYEVEFSIKQFRMKGFTYKCRQICIKQHEPLISQVECLPLWTSSSTLGSQGGNCYCALTTMFSHLQNTNTHKFQEISMHPTQDHTPQCSLFLILPYKTQTQISNKLWSSHTHMNTNDLP